MTNLHDAHAAALQCHANPAPCPKQLREATASLPPHVWSSYPILTGCIQPHSCKTSKPHPSHALLAPRALDADALALRHLRVAHCVADREPAGVAGWGTALDGAGAKCERRGRLTGRAKRLRLPRRRAKALESGRRMRRAKGAHRWNGRCLRRHAERARCASKPACNPQAARPSGALPMNKTTKDQPTQQPQSMLRLAWRHT